MIRRRTCVLLACVLLQLVCRLSFAQDVPGSRPDMSGGWSGLDENLRRQAIAVFDSSQSVQTADPKSGWIRKSPKERAEDELKTKQNDLLNYLASPPTGSQKGSGTVRLGPSQSNCEAIEISNGFANVQAMMVLYRQKLIDDPKNIECAKEAYKAHIACLRSLVTMNEEFVANVDKRYRPAIEDLIATFSGLIERSDELLGRALVDVGPNSDLGRDKIQKIKDRQIAVLSRLHDAIDKLVEQQCWARKNIPVLRARMDVANLAFDTVKATEIAKLTIRDIIRDYSAVQTQLPPLIVFDVDLKDYSM